MYVDGNVIIGAAGIVTAIIAVVGRILSAHKWYLKQEKQEEDIKKMKQEQQLLTYGVLACLKGLKEQGCNGPVTEAITKIEKHINAQAHE